MKCWLAVLILVLGAGQAWGKTFYVDNSCAENGDGTSTVCGATGPWNSLAAAAPCEGMAPGDTLEIRAGVYREATWRPGPGCAGLSGKVVTIQNFAGHDVVLDGTRDIRTSVWKSVGRGVHRCATGVCGTDGSFPFTAWYDSGEGEERLDLVQSNRSCSAALPPGKMTYTADGAVCAHLWDGSDPADADTFAIPWEPAAIDLTDGDADFVTIRRHPTGGTFTIRRFRDRGVVSSTANLTLTLNQLDVGWMMGRCLDQTGGNVLDAALRITNNHVHHCGQEGIRWSNDRATASVISGNEVDSIQTEPVFERCGDDCLPGFAAEAIGIRIAGSSRGSVRLNTIHHIGSAGPWRAFGIRMESPYPGIRIDSNYITAISVGRAAGAFGAAVSLAGLGRLDDSPVRNNRMHAVDVCVHLDLDPDKTAGERADIVSNTCNEPAWKGVFQPVGLRKWDIFLVNNVFRAVEARPELMVDLAVEPGIAPLTSNDFHCPSCTALARIAGMTFASGDIDSLGRGNVVGDPNLDTDGARPTLKIKGPAGAAFDHGAALSPFFFDFEGTPRPMHDDWDIGADEYGAPPAESPFELAPEWTRPEMPPDAGTTVDKEDSVGGCHCNVGGRSRPQGLALVVVVGLALTRRRLRALLLALLIGGCGGGPPPDTGRIDPIAQPVGRPAGPIMPQDPVQIRVRHAGGSVTDLRVEWFVDDVAREDEPHQMVSLSGQIPAQPANSIVRYRLFGRRDGATEELLSPLPSDPYDWHAYFVEPNIPGRTPAYHIFISPANWGTLWTNDQPGWVTGCGVGENPDCRFCAPNPKWDATVPAVFVSQGRVYDVEVRYQGGLFNRLAGRALASWKFPGPAAGPMPPTALGWKVKFPKHASFEGKRSIKLNKRDQMCTGIPDMVMSHVFEAAGIPEMHYRYRRLFINGGYYLYAMEVEHMDEDLLGRYFGKKEPIGDLYNVNAIRWDEGPWGWGDFRPLQPFCGFSPKERYTYNYERQTLQAKGNDDLIALVEGLHTARAIGDNAVRAYLDQNFDRELVLRYIAIINWSGAWDDDYHNYFLYKRPGHRWMIMSSDLNRLLIGDPTLSFYLGRAGEPGNGRGRWNYLKDSYLRVFQKEYDEVLRRLTATLFDPEVVKPWIDEAAASLDPIDAAGALSFRAPVNTVACDEPGPQAWQVQNFVRERHRVLKRRLGIP